MKRKNKKQKKSPITEIIRVQGTIWGNLSDINRKIYRTRKNEFMDCDEGCPYIFLETERFKVFDGNPKYINGDYPLEKINKKTKMYNVGLKKYYKDEIPFEVQDYKWLIYSYKEFKDNSKNNVVIKGVELGKKRKDTYVIREYKKRGSVCVNYPMLQSIIPKGFPEIYEKFEELELKKDLPFLNSKYSSLKNKGFF